MGEEIKESPRELGKGQPGTGIEQVPLFVSLYASDQKSTGNAGKGNAGQVADNGDGQATTQINAETKPDQNPPPAKDKIAENDKPVGAQRPERTENPNPYYHLKDVAGPIAERLDLILATHTDPNEKKLVRINGELQEITVGKEVEILKQQLKAAMETAKRCAEKLPHDRVNADYKENSTKRERLIKELGLDPEVIKNQSIDKVLNVLGTEHQKAERSALNAKTDAERKPFEDRQQKIRELTEVLVKRNSLALFHQAPLMVQSLETEYKVKGYLDPNIKMGDFVPDSVFKDAQKDLAKLNPLDPKELELFGAPLKTPAGDPTPPTREMLEGADVLSKASEAILVHQRANEYQKYLKIVYELKMAEQPGVKNPEQHLKEALRVADMQNVNFVAGEIFKFQALEAGQDPPPEKKVSDELRTYIHMGAVAKLRNAENLVSKGDNKAAELLMLQVRTDAPEMIYDGTFDSKTGRPNYRVHPLPGESEVKEKDGKPQGRTFKELDNILGTGLVHSPAAFDAAHGIFLKKLTDNKLGNQEADTKKIKAKWESGELKDDKDTFAYIKEDSATDIEAFAVMRRTATHYRTDINEANNSLKVQRDKDLAALKANEVPPLTEEQFNKRNGYIDKLKSFSRQEANGTPLTPEQAKEKTETESEKRKLDVPLNQTQTLEQQVESRRLRLRIDAVNNTVESREKYINRVEALADFSEGCMHLAHGGAQSAHELFDKALKKDPSLEEEFVRLKAKGEIPDLKTITELRDMTANTLDGYWKRNAGKFAIAGAAAVGTLTGVGIIGAGASLGWGVTTTAVVATTGGALTGGGTSWLIHKSVNPNAGWAEFRDGAKVGGLSAALVAAPWTAQAYRAKVGLEAGAPSLIGSAAAKVGLTKGTLMGSMAMSYTFAAGDVLIADKPVGRAFSDATKEGVFNSLLLGITRNWGLPSDGAVKQAMFTKPVVATGVTLGVAPEVISVIVDGKETSIAAKDALHHSFQYTLTLGIMNKITVQEPGKLTGLGKVGLNKWTVGGGFGLAALPEMRNYYEGRKSAGEATVDWLQNGAIDTAAFAFLKRSGMADEGTGKVVRKPTGKDAWDFGKRAFLMQESWNVALTVATEQVEHDLMRKPSREGQGFLAPLIVNFYQMYWGAELDATHAGDRKAINANVDGLSSELEATTRVDLKNVDPTKISGEGGLFWVPPKRKQK